MLLFLGVIGFRVLEVLVKPGDGLSLRLVAGFVVNAVVLDALNGHQLLDAAGPLIGQNRMVLVVEQFLVLGDDE